MRYLSHGVWLMMLSLLGTCSGCGGETSIPRASVEGEVTWNGKAVEEGVVLFVPSGDSAGKDLSPVPAQIVDGSYVLDAKDGPPVGQHRIEIRGIRKTGKRTPEPTAAMKRFDPNLKSVELTEQYLPKRFNASSTLSREVHAGENQIDFHLTSDQ